MSASATMMKLTPKMATAAIGSNGVVRCPCIKTAMNPNWGKPCGWETKIRKPRQLTCRSCGWDFLAVHSRSLVGLGN
jgi:hypothetical protein